MSAEPWRRSGTPVAPRLFAWQAWYFGDLRLWKSSSSDFFGLETSQGLRKFRPSQINDVTLFVRKHSSKPVWES